MVIDNNDFTYAVQSSTSGPNSKIFLDTSGSSPGSAVTIEHNDIENGDLDGVHIGGGSGDLILANRFQNLCDRGVNHTDNLQFEGGSQITDRRATTSTRRRTARPRGSRRTTAGPRGS